MNSTRIHDSHGNGDGIRRCEGSRNLSIPIGLLRFSRRGRQGSALFQETLVSGVFLVILVICGDFWWIPLKMEEIGENGNFTPKYLKITTFTPLWAETRPPCRGSLGDPRGSLGDP